MRDKKRAKELLAELQFLADTSFERKMIKSLISYMEMPFERNFEGELEGEEWRDIEGFPDYQVSSFGRVRSFKKARGKNPYRILSGTLSRGGYLGVSLHSNNGEKSVAIHRLVAETFLPNPEGKECVDHINNLKFDNRAVNLRWATRSENTCYAILTGAKKESCGCEHYESRFTAEQIRWIRENYKPNDRNYGAAALARKFGISITSMGCIIHRKTYRDVG